MNLVKSEPGPIRSAWVQAMAEGIGLHLPAGVGILARGVPLLALAALAHLVLDVSAPISLAGAGVATNAYGILSHLVNRG